MMIHVFEIIFGPVVLDCVIVRVKRHLLAVSRNLRLKQKSVLWFDLSRMIKKHGIDPFHWLLLVPLASL